MPDSRELPSDTIQPQGAVSTDGKPLRERVAEYIASRYGERPTFQDLLDADAIIAAVRAEQPEDAVRYEPCTYPPCQELPPGAKHRCSKGEFGHRLPEQANGPVFTERELAWIGVWMNHGFNTNAGNEEWACRRSIAAKLDGLK